LELASAERVPEIAFGDPDRRSAEVTLLRGSVARDVVLVRYRVPFAPNADAVVLARSPLAWEGLDLCEPWRELTRPLSDLPRLGRIDERRPWFVTFTARALGRARELAAQHDGQVHALLERPFGAAWSRDVVYWPAWRNVTFALLGRASAIVPSGPLCALGLDGERAGIFVHWPEAPGDVLAGLVAPGLAHSDELWRAAAQNVLSVRAGHAPSPLISASWLRKGRALARSQPARGTALATKWELALRRYGKLRREPDRYFADSRYAHWRAFGRFWFR
jgi:hypothetical protein